MNRGLLRPPRHFESLLRLDVALVILLLLELHGDGPGALGLRQGDVKVTRLTAGSGLELLLHELALAVQELELRVQGPQTP